MRININTKKSTKNKIMGITPIVCLIAFILIWYFTGSAHPAWMVFFLVPVMSIILGFWKIKITYPIVCTLIYFIGCFIFDMFGIHLWHPGWVIFLTIPIFEIIVSKSDDDDDDDGIEVEID